MSLAEVQQAVRRSIETEKHAMDFYRLGATKLQDQAARKMFEILAQEERAHAGSFYRIYTGSDIASLEAFLDAPPAHEGEWLASLARLIKADFSEAKALELAMQKEQQLETALSKLAASITDPATKSVYEMNVRETHNHYLQIEAEYARLMGMVDETDMDTFVRE
jgi:rubrerythrin